MHHVPETAIKTINSQIIKNLDQIHDLVLHNLSNVSLDPEVYQPNNNILFVANYILGPQCCAILMDYKIMHYVI